MGVIDEILNHVRQNHNFLLSGGAGSGKTYTLVNVLRGIIEEFPSKHIACITYTNAAVEEIRSRVNHTNVSVSTIHDFLWENIRHYQPQLKRILAELVNDPECNEIKMSDGNPIEDDYFFGNDIERIEYKEYLQLSKGVISHDEVIVLARAMFEHFPKLCNVVVSKHPFIMIDEYQDTHEDVVKIMLECLSPKELPKGRNRCLVGFFGDAMQSIYDDGVGDIFNYVRCDDSHVYEVKMEYNRRNPQKVIDLANKLRTDGLVQEPSNDADAPNMKDGKVKEGVVKFIYSLNPDTTLDIVKQYIEWEYKWIFSDTKNTKELDLTYNLIAGRGGFPNLNEIYSGDPLLDYRDKIKKLIKDKNCEEDFGGLTFGEVIDRVKVLYPDNQKNWTMTSKQISFVDSNQNWYDYVLKLDYEKFRKMYVERDQLIDDNKQNEDEEGRKGSKRSPLIKHLIKIIQAMESYRKGRTGDFLRVTGKRYLQNAAEKKSIKDDMDTLNAAFSSTVADVMKVVAEKNILVSDDKLEAYKEEYCYIYDRVMELQFNEILSLYNYLEGRTPFSTQHKTKGAEYDNVFVLMDNGRWNDYNFEHLLAGTPKGKSENPKKRTNKLFYVCCTRAKEQLLMFFPEPNVKVITEAEALFGKDDVICIDK